TCSWKPWSLNGSGKFPARNSSWTCRRPSKQLADEVCHPGGGTTIKGPDQPLGRLLCSSNLGGGAVERSLNCGENFLAAACANGNAFVRQVDGVRSAAQRYRHCRCAECGGLHQHGGI